MYRSTLTNGGLINDRSVVDGPTRGISRIALGARAAIAQK